MSISVKDKQVNTEEYQLSSIFDPFILYNQVKGNATPKQHEEFTSSLIRDAIISFYKNSSPEVTFSRTTKSLNTFMIQVDANFTSRNSKENIMNCPEGYNYEVYNKKLINQEFKDYLLSVLCLDIMKMYVSIDGKSIQSFAVINDVSKYKVLDFINRSIKSKRKNPEFNFSTLVFLENELDLDSLPDIDIYFEKI